MGTTAALQTPVCYSNYYFIRLIINFVAWMKSTSFKVSNVFHLIFVQFEEPRWRRVTWYNFGIIRLLNNLSRKFDTLSSHLRHFKLIFFNFSGQRRIHLAHSFNHMECSVSVFFLLIADTFEFFFHPINNLWPNIFD